MPTTSGRGHTRLPVVRIRRWATVLLGALLVLGTAPAYAAGSATLPAAPRGFQVTPGMLTAGVVALGVGLLVLLAGVLGGLGRKQESIASRIDAYTGRGASAAQRRPVGQTAGVTAQAVSVAQRALQGNRGLESRLGVKLEAGGLTLKPAEWVLVHAGLAVGVTLVAFLVTGADVLVTLMALGAGLVGPWVYLGRKQSKRLKEFNAQLAATLQLLAGSLQAGLSIAQGMDTIVREGAEPVAGEFRRALVETRLGVQVEDALDAVAERMMSEDFKWTVMAIRIQREVGGNLAELLLNVSATLREREYLRRQVKSLSAEGRFSAYILLAMPPGILLYMSMVNRDYLQPLLSTPIGLLMLAMMGVLMGVGAFMMNRMVKLEV
jgi:tight adherence protein B